MPGPITPQVEITEVGRISSVNSAQDPTIVLPPSNPTPIDPNSGSPTSTNQSIGNYVGYSAKTNLPKLVYPGSKEITLSLDHLGTVLKTRSIRIQAYPASTSSITYIHYWRVLHYWSLRGWL